ncbi:unnamed protein product [Didymodactylos carnosus]|uniref:Ras-related protein Rab-21 n=1 Tax=Didymodactylos carnosus TaxID=1234261 RepID=A0A8S2D3G6_9BILA|nr:unnamed protein product [Didymodactylos carnosus]CAF3653937.1 unnamed protein product [Didymodactylos carnosus]
MDTKSLGDQQFCLYAAFFNDLSYNINLDTCLLSAETLYKQLSEHRDVPTSIGNLLAIKESKILLSSTSQTIVSSSSTASFKTKKLTLDGKRVELAIWDTAGQERFRALGPLYYRDSNGAILVFDITDEDSFERVKSWTKELRRILGNDCVLCIVGNKIDLEKDRHVPMQIAEDYAKSVGAKLYHTSAKSNKGIEELFNDLAQRLLERLPATTGGTDAVNGPNRISTGKPRGIAIEQSSTEQNNGGRSGGGCCS